MESYQSSSSPSTRRVRIFLEEKGIEAPVVPINLGAKKQFSEAYRAINPRHVVPPLTPDDGAAIGEVLAIWRDLEKAFPERPLLGSTPQEKALVTMWERRTELEGFAAVLDAVRNSVSGLMGHAPTGPYDYEQIPELAERSQLLARNFYADLDARLAVVPVVAGEQFSANDITAIVTAGIKLEEHVSLKRWHDTVSARPGMQA